MVTRRSTRTARPAKRSAQVPSARRQAPGQDSPARAPRPAQSALQALELFQGRLHLNQKPPGQLLLECL